METSNNNLLTVSGAFSAPLKLNHETHGSKIYSTELSVGRLSGKFDLIPVYLHEDLLDQVAIYFQEDSSPKEGCLVMISGELRTHNIGRKLIVYLYAKTICQTDAAGVNEIKLEGHLCKPPIYREKECSGRKITDVLLAVNRPNGISDYIPCISWGMNAVHMSYLQTGAHIAISGRMQSRNYLKTLESGEVISRTTHEVSISQFETIEEELNDENSKSGRNAE
jgi:hypothetical protein